MLDDLLMVDASGVHLGGQTMREKLAGGVYRMGARRAGKEESCRGRDTRLHVGVLQD